MNMMVHQPSNTFELLCQDTLILSTLMQAALLLPAAANLGPDAMQQLTQYDACAPQVPGGNSSGLSLFGGGQDITNDPVAVAAALAQVADVLAAAGIVLGKFERIGSLIVCIDR